MSILGLWIAAMVRWGTVVLLFMTMNHLDTELSGEGELNRVAVWLICFSDTILDDLNLVITIWNTNALVFSVVLAVNNWQMNWLINTFLDWLLVGHIHIVIFRGHERHIVLGLLWNFLAVVVAISPMAVSIAIS